MITLLLVILLLSTTMMVFCNESIFELNPENFNEQVVGDERVWMIEFYSPMCGSCQEFSPTWKKLAQLAKSLAKAEVNIDTKQGMALAERLGALAEGIPNVRLFTRAGDPRGTSIVNGKLLTEVTSMAFYITVIFIQGRQ
jgi:thioredoxin-like negative regulator of GroEL